MKFNDKHVIETALNTNPVTTGNIKLCSVGDCYQYLQYLINSASPGGMQIQAYSTTNKCPKVGESSYLFYAMLKNGKPIPGHSVNVTITRTGEGRYEMIATLIEIG